MFFVAKSWSMMIPSAPLSNRARALISCPDIFPTRVTLRVIEGDRLLRIVSPGTGSESMVSNREDLFMRNEHIQKVLSDSATEGHIKNPEKIWKRSLLQLELGDLLVVPCRLHHELLKRGL